MQIVIFVSNGHLSDKHCSFAQGTFSSERKVSVVVPDGSGFIGTGDLACLRTPDGIIHPASDVLELCKARADGFAVVP